MKMSKQKIVNYVFTFYIVITGLLNVYGYFNLPDKISTHFSLSGKTTGSQTPTSIYLLITFVIVLFISFTGMKKESGQKLKYILVDTLIVVCHFILVIMQLQ